MPPLSARSRRKGDHRRRRHFAAEPLEPRNLLATLSADTKSPIDAALIRIAVDAAPGGIGPLEPSAIIAAAQAAGLDVNGFAELGVTITAVDTTALVPALEAIGANITADLPSYHHLEGYLPVTALESLLDLQGQGLLGARANYAPLTRAGIVADQADVVHESNRVRDALPTGYDGTGVKVGVLSDSYNSNFVAPPLPDVASGDLPAGIQVLQDTIGTDEGRAMLELIHDTAPGASMAFATAFQGQAGFANNIRALAAAGCDVIVDDVGYFAEPMFQDGIIAQAVDEVTGNGVAYFSAAGNMADQSYESGNIDFVLDPLGFGPFGTTKCYDFDPSPFFTDTRQSVTIPDGGSAIISFQWDDPFYTAGGVDTDLDIFIVREDTNTVVASSYTQNVIDQTPGEVLVFNNDTGASNFEIIINHQHGPFPERLKYVEFRRQMSINEYDTSSSTIYGHSAAAGGIAVAAAPYFNQGQAESFSSYGRTRILFNPDGTPLAADEIRNTPQMTAIDGTNTTFFGSDFEGDSFPNFFGTSAAAPHAAAIAALILQANPTFTPQQIYQRMQDTAIDLGAPGHDRITGAGLVNAYDAIFGPAQPALPQFNGTDYSFTDSFEPDPGFPGKPTVLSQAWETNSTGAGRMTVTNANGPVGPGVQHLALDAFIASGVSLNEAILHLNLDNFSNVVLSFQEKETNDDDHPMPATFTGSVNADGVALSVDGVNWYRLVELTDVGSPPNPPSTANYQLFTVDLDQFATNNALTLGADVRIKFQQYGIEPATNDGIFIDEISVNGVLTNTPPTAVDDPIANSPEDTDYVIAGSILTGNDTDPENDNLRVIAVSNPTNGTVSVNGNVVTFIPNQDYNGPASFEYTVTDDNGTGSDVGLATFNVTPVNDDPIAVDDPISGATQNNDFVIPGGTLTANDTDVDLDPLNVVAAGNPVNGTVDVSGGIVTFHPTPGYDGPASFEYSVSDGNATDVGLVTFTVVGSNDAPTALAANVSTNEDTPLGGTLTYTDPEFDAVTFELTAIPSHGLITSFDANTGAYTYTPTGNYNGPDSFAFKVNDGALDSASATISITVNSVNDAPVLYPSAPQLVGFSKGATNPPGTVINDMLSGRVTDADGSFFRGIAITFVTGTTSGQWQYKFDALPWTNLPAVTQSAALLLPGRAQIRFVPGLASFTGTVTMNYRAWDQTQGTLGGTWDLSNKATSTGGSTAFSAAFDTASLKVDKPPVLIQSNPSPVGYKLNSNPGVNFMIDASFNKTKLSDFDSPDFDSGILRVHTSIGRRTGDRITVGWSFSFLGTNVIYQGKHIGDVVSDGIDGNDLAIRLNAACTVKLTEQLINSLRFKTVAGVKGTRTLQVNVGDGDGGTSNTLTRQVIVN